MKMFKIYCENKQEFYQWDLNQKLIVEDATIEEVHFCNGTSDCALCTIVYDYEGKRIVDVPNIILQTAKTFRAFGYTSGATLVEDKFRVNARTKPTDYVYTETEIKNWDSFKEEVTNSIDDAVNVAFDEVVGDIESALDAVIAIQDSILGVSE